MTRLEPRDTPPNWECRWHDGQPKHDCPQCEAAWDAWENRSMSLYEEQRIPGRNNAEESRIR